MSPCAVGRFLLNAGGQLNLRNGKAKYGGSYAAGAMLKVNGGSAVVDSCGIGPSQGKGYSWPEGISS